MSRHYKILIRLEAQTHRHERAGLITVISVPLRQTKPLTGGSETQTQTRYAKRTADSPINRLSV